MCKQTRCAKQHCYLYPNETKNVTSKWVTLVLLSHTNLTCTQAKWLHRMCKQTCSEEQYCYLYTHETKKKTCLAHETCCSPGKLWCPSWKWPQSKTWKSFQAPEEYTPFSADLCLTHFMLGGGWLKCRTMSSQLTASFPSRLKPIPASW